MTDVQQISRELLANEARNLHAIQKNAKAIDAEGHRPSG
jgi:hypothetical protein